MMARRRQLAHTHAGTPQRSIARTRLDHKIYQNSFKHSHCGVIIVESRTGVICDANPYALRVFGLPLSKLKGKKMYQTGICNNENQYGKIVSALKTKTQIQIDDVVLKTARGTYVDVECFFSAHDIGVQHFLHCSLRDITAYKETARQLQISNRRASHILESISDGFVAIDHEWRYTYMNHQAANLFGGTRERLMGKSLFKVHPHFKETVFYRKYLYAKTAKRKVAFHKIYPALGKWFSVHVYPSVDGLAVYFSDITHQKEIERELRGIEEKYRFMIESVKDYALFVFDRHGVITTWSKGAERIYGYSTDEIVGMHVRVLYPVEDHKKSKAEREIRLAVRKERLEVEGWRLHKNTSSFWANEVTTALVTPSGVLRGFTRLTKDISDRKMAEEALRERTRELEMAKDQVEREKAEDEALLDSIGEGVVATDDFGVVKLINLHAQALLGVSSSDAVGAVYTDLWNMEDSLGNKVPDEKRSIMSVLRTGKKVSASNYYYSTKSKKPFPVAAVTSPVILNGRTVGTVMVFRDIRREKEVDKAKSEFVSLASHQLRTPLTAIKLFIEMFQSGTVGELNKNQKEIVGDIRESNEKMIQLVESLLNVSRLETGKIKLKFEPVDLVGFMRRAVLGMKHVARAKKVALLLKFSSGNLPKARIDPHMMNQVIGNLVSNAIDYSHSGPDKMSPVRITVGYTKDDGFTIAVENRGIGIPKENQHRIFERFFRADNAMKVKTEGTGLGLYMSKIVVELHGGKIWLVSEESKTTTFYVRIPHREAYGEQEPYHDTQ